jgi:membrane-associated phospholipid phosphatase
MFFAGGALACLISTIVNFWWKISAHMAGIGGLLALLWQIDAMELEIISRPWMVAYILIAIILSGLLGSARLLLKRHTLPQVIAGFLNGLICVSLMMRLFG